MESYLITGFIVALIIGVIPAKIAQSKGKDFETWYIYGVLLFFFAMIHAIVLPEKDKSENSNKKLIKTVKNSLTDFKNGDISNEIRYVDVNCPIEVRGLEIQINEKTGLTYCLVKFFNLSEKVVSSVKVIIRCYDSFGQPVEETGQHEVEAIIQDEVVKSKEYFGTNKPIALPKHSSTRKVDIIITDILFSDNSTWQKGDYELQNYNIEAITDSEEFSNLRDIVGKDTICYPKQDKSAWVCTCGRLNSNSEIYCKRCERTKSNIFEKYYNKDAILKELAIQQKEQNKKEQKNKIRKKKNIIITSCISSIVLILFLLGYLTDFTFSYEQYALNYRTIVNSTDMYPFIDRSINDEDVQEFLVLLGNKKKISEYDECYFYIYDNKGIDVRFKPDGTLEMIFLNKNYKGKLPSDIRFSDSREIAEKKLGKPLSTEGEYGVIYNNFSIWYSQDFSSINSLTIK